MDETLSLLVKNIPNAISICGCLWVFACYLKASVKTIGFKMVLILSISDSMFHTLVIAKYWTDSPSLSTIETFISNAMVRFSLFWASNISFFLYKMLGLNHFTYLRKHLRWSLVLLLLLSAGLGIIVLTQSEQDFWAGIWTMVLPLIVSFCATIFFYYRSKYITRKKGVSSLLENSTRAVKSLYGFSFTQIATLCPFMIYDMALALGMEGDQVLQAVVETCLGLTGFANTLLFFVHRHKSTFSESKQSHGGNDITKISTLSSQSMREALIVEYHQQ